MKKKTRNLIVSAAFVLILAIGVFLTVKLSGQKDGVRDVNISNASNEQDTGKFKTIGLLAGDMQDKSVYNTFNNLKDFSKENDNIKMILYDSEAKADKQLLQLEELISMKVDGIILDPVRESFPEDILLKLKKSGIPVVLVYSDSTNDYFASSINSSPEQIGETQAAYIAGKLNSGGNILVFTESRDSGAESGRLKGFRKIIARNPAIKVTEVSSTLFDQVKEQEKLLNTLKTYRATDAIVIQQSNLSIKVLSLLEKLENKPEVIGVDDIPDVLQTLKEGSLDATAYVNSSEIASAAYDTMMKVLKKEKVPKQRIIPCKLITSGNMDDFIKNNLNYLIK